MPTFPCRCHTSCACARRCAPLCTPCSYEGLVKDDKCHVRGVFKYSNGDR